MSPDYFLEHYGVKGMKWGIRKERGGSKSASKVAATLSDKELQKRVKRLNMEKQYVELVAKKNERDRSAMDRGKAEVRSILVKATRQGAQELANKATNDLFNLALAGSVTAINKKKGS